MALLPENSFNIGETVDIESQPSYTYYFDVDQKKIIGFIDGIEAIKQAIYKIIETERYHSLIYDWDYGIEINNMIGKDPLYVSADLERIFSEALLQDSRILSISDFDISQTQSDEFLVSFTANTIEGDIQIEGVSTNV
jgi:hypothetical protein